MRDYYEKSSPIQVKGGIKAQSKRGEFSSSWWGKRWIQALESFLDSARLSRGKSYARKGQVLSIDILEGSITSKVQGSRSTPYTVKIEMDILKPSAWQLVIDALSQKAIYTARLLAGELPSDIEEIFKEVRVQLLPFHHADLKTDCSCPDWSNPCKHVAAVFYLLGEEFDRDPFLLFKVRGMDRANFLKQLEKQSFEQPSELFSKEENPVPLEVISFWTGTEIPSDWLQGSFEKPNQTGVLLKSLGKFPFWRGEADLNTSLWEIYSQNSSKALSFLEIEPV